MNDISLHDVLGISLAVAFICFCLWVVVHYTKGLGVDDTMKFMFIFIVTIFIATWVDDNIVMPRLQILDEEENKTILQLMSTFCSALLGYWLRGKIEEKK